ncbi:MAG: tetratricopeptide repeat protein [bacterium]|nr:tetratricopeptide repeat protein [bacterium]
MMDTPHISADEYYLGLREGLSSASRMRWFRHLVEPCSECLKVLRCIARKPESPEKPDKLPAGLNDPLMAAIRLLVEAYRAAGPEPGCAQNVRLPDHLSPNERTALRQVMAGQPLGGCRLILEVSRRQAVEQPSRAVEFVPQALFVVEKKDLGKGREKSFADLECRAHAYLGEAYRLTGDRDQAQQAHRHASTCQERGTGDPDLAATLYELSAARARDRGDLEQALALLERSKDSLAAVDDPIAAVELAARKAVLLIHEGNVLSQIGESERAHAAFDQALSLVESGDYPRLRLSARHDQAVDKVQDGDFAAALAYLEEAGPLYEQYGDDLIRAQRCWLLGTIYLKDQKPKPAEKMLRQARDQYLKLGLPYDAVRIMIDLGQLYLVDGRLRELAELLELLGALFTRPDLQWVILAELRRLRGLARERGLPVRSLSEIIEELETSLEPKRVN